MRTADNTLAFVDQGCHLWDQASGHVHGIQCIWVYERDIDMAGLRRTLDNLGHGLLGRRVERSPLPLGRHRWVTSPEAGELDIAPPVASYAELAPWAAARARLPVDPESGPGWHVGVLPIEGYGTAISLVASHIVLDGVGLCLALADATKGVRHDFGYPPPQSRTVRRALFEDVRQSARGLPEVGRALGAAARLARRARKESGRSKAASPVAPATADTRSALALATVTAYVDLPAWDARAAALGGTSNALFAGFAARLAERIGRVHADDGLVTLMYPVNDRVEGDTRGNALKSIDFSVDPKPVTSDLGEIRGDIRAALKSGGGNFADNEDILPLIPLIPKAVIKRLPLDAVGAADLPVGCSNLGDIDPAAACADGTPADSLSLRLVAQNFTSQSPEHTHGELYLAAGRVCGKLFLYVRAHQRGTENSKHDLWQQVSGTLADFGLSAAIE
jgi:diacylglycerol O-acyltransferase / wax synthase